MRVIRKKLQEPRDVVRAESVATRYFWQGREKQGEGMSDTTELLEKLANPDTGSYKKQEIIRTLVAENATSAADEIAGFLTDTDRYLRREAVKALSVLPAPIASDRLADCLSDTDYVLREFAAKGLGLSGSRKHITALEGVSEDMFSSVRTAAQQAISQIQSRPDSDQGPPEPAVSVAVPLLKIAGWLSGSETSIVKSARVSI